MYKRKGKVEEIQFLKGIAIIMVVLVHSPQKISGINYGLNQILRLGRWGCQLFFLISGFLFVLSTDKQEEFNLISYYKKRICAIIPAWYIALLSYRLMFWIICDIYKYDFFYDLKNDISGIICNALMLHGVSQKSYNNIVPGGWYIGTQWLIYLIAPLLWKIYKKCDTKKINKLIIPFVYAVISGGIQVILAFLFKDLSRLKIGSLWNYSIFTQLPCFLLGMLLAEELKKKKFETRNLMELVARGGAFFTVATLLYFFSSRIVVFSVIVPVIYAYGFFYFCLVVFRIFRKYKKNCIVKGITKYGEVSYAAYYMNFIWTMMFPWFLDEIAGLKIYGNGWYIFLLVPMMLGTYFTSQLYSKFLNVISKKLKIILKI